MTAQSGAADEQRTTNDEKHSGPCPDCGGRTYYEPNISHGTRHEATSGWACLSCPWTKLDPTSGESRPTPASDSSTDRRYSAGGQE